jgi:hypothetical protein
MPAEHHAGRQPAAITSVHQSTTRWWYLAVPVGIPLAGAILVAYLQVWTGLAILLPIAIGFLAAGPPLRAEVHADGSIQFIHAFRRPRVTAQGLRALSAVRAGDPREHLTLRLHHGLPVSYRQHEYTEPHTLAAAVIALANTADTLPSISPQALDILQRAAEGR